MGGLDRMYDESPAELDKMKRRREIRFRLKSEFNRFIHNPLVISYNMNLPQPQLERYYAARNYRIEFLKRKWYHSIPLPLFLASIFFYHQINRNLIIDNFKREANYPPEWLYQRRNDRVPYVRTLYTKYFPYEAGV